MISKDLNNKLLDASKYSNLKEVERLLELGADVEFKNIYGWTALILASYYGASAIAKLLLEAGADINAKTTFGSKAIHLARSVEMVQVLIDYGTDPEAIGSNNQTLLQKLKIDAEGNQDLIRVLVEDYGLSDDS
jgi:ankyrin repeat protein